MATTRDYVDYLSDQIDIAPVNSQEELQAAELLQHIMEQHRLEVSVQEFETPSSGVLPYRILMILMFIGVVMAGFYGTPVAAVGVVLVFLCGALFLLKQVGYDFLSNLGSKARSQNVIGVHRAEGPLVVKGNRPIVIVAHYDTPRESILYKGGFARIQPLIKRIAPALVALVFVLGIFQLFGFVPVIARRVLWVIGLIVALPLLLLGVDAVYGRFSPCTEGANDNKSSLAAMLGVLDKVRPGEDDASGFSHVMDDKRAAARAVAAAREEEEARLRAAAEAEAAEAAAAADAEYGMELEEYDEFDAAEDLDEAYDDEDFGALDESDAFDYGAENADVDGPAFEDEGKAPASPFASVAGVFNKFWPFKNEASDGEPLEEEPFEEDAEFYEDDFGEEFDEPQIDGNPEFDNVSDLGEEYGEVPNSDVAEDLATTDGGSALADEEDLQAYAEDVYAEPDDYSEPDDYNEPDAYAEPDDYNEPDAYAEPDDYNEPDAYAESGDYDEPDAYAEADYDEPVVFAQPVAYNEPEEPAPVPVFDDEPYLVQSEGAEQADFEPSFAPMPFEDDYDDAGFEEPQDLSATDDVMPEAEPSEEPAAEPEPFIPSFARVRTAAPVVEPEPEIPAEPEVAPQVVTDRYEEVVGVRHGKEVVESLRMLPIGCEVEYVEPRLLSRSVRPQDEIDRAEFGVITAGPSDDWEPIIHSNRRDRTSLERPSFFSRIGNFFSQLSAQFFGEEIDDDDMVDADFEDDYGFDEGEFDERLDSSYWDDPAEPTQGAAPVAEEADYGEEELQEDSADYGEGYEDYDENYVDEYATEYADAAQVDYAHDEDAYAPAPVDRSVLAPNLSFQDEPLPTEDEIAQMDGSGLTEVVDYDLNDSEPRAIKPAPKAEGVDDPTWGRSEYQPPRSSVARRASLFDLPDPSSRSTDPFADAGMTSSRGRSSLRLVEDDEDPRNGKWKGGATTRAGLREGEEEAFETLDNLSQGTFPEDFDEEPIEEPMAEEPVVEEAMDIEQQQELRDAILSMSDDELIAHDIWFVALGASELNHAGMTSFLRENRSKIRGAFMVNLDSIGAGALTMLTREGLFNSRKTDRRMLRMLGNIADDLHISVDKAEYGWDETDATQAMRKSVRALTIMGVENGVAALSHTAEDTAEAVDPAQVADVAAMVTELIRRA